MATIASGRNYNAIVGIQEGGSLAIGGDGSLAAGDFISSSNVFMRLNQISGILIDLS